MSKKTNNKRVNFATSKILDYPDLLEVQLKSFKDFFQLETTPDSRKNEGLFQVFQEIFPIEDTRNNYKLEFIDYFIDPPQYSIEECLDRGLTYNVPLKAKLRLSCTDPDHEDFDTIVQDVYLGNIPYMTPGGESSFHSFTAPRASSSTRACTPTGPSSIRPASSPSRAPGSNSRRTSTMSCTPTSTGRRSSPSRRF